MALDLADLARRAAEFGGDEAIASVSVRRELVAHAGPSGALVPPRRTFDVLVRLLVRDGAGRLGVARCSTSTSDAHLQALADRAHDNAAASPINLMRLPVVEQGPAHDGFDALTADLDPARAAGVARAAASSVGYDLGSGRSALWRGEDVETAVASSDGGAAQDRRTGAQLIVRAADSDGRLTGFGQASAAVADLIDPLMLGIAATPPAVPFRAGSGPLLASRDDQVVLLPAALAPLLEVLARAACTGHAHATGTSPFTGRLGTAVAGALITLSDDPLHPATLPRSGDVEGVPVSPTVLVDAGVERDVVHDSISADEAGAVSTGHAAELGGSPAGPAPRNLVLDAGGAASTGELGLAGPSIVIPVVERVVPAGPGSSRFSALGRAAYVVDDGQPTQLLGDVVLSGDLTDMLAGIESLTAATELVATLDRLPERTRATLCPAAMTRGLTVLAV